MVDVYLEVGAKRTFAGAVAWPGWCRGGRTREQALEALCGASERYGRVLRGTRLVGRVNAHKMNAHPL